MAICSIAKSPLGLSARDRAGRLPRWADPRTIVGFANLMTIGIAAVGGTFGLLVAGSGDRGLVIAISVLTIAICWATTLAVAWLFLLLRSLTAVCATLWRKLAGRPPGNKPRVPDLSTGVSDAWLDGAV